MTLEVISGKRCAAIKIEDFFSGLNLSHIYSTEICQIYVLLKYTYGETIGIKHL